MRLIRSNATNYAHATTKPTLFASPHTKSITLEWHHQRTRQFYRSKIKFFIATFTSFLLLAACDDDSSTDPALTAGKVTDSGIEGLDYRTESEAGNTRENSGEFVYRHGENIDFSVGDLSIAVGVPADRLLSLMQLREQTREKLKEIDIVNGLSTHTTAEINLADDAEANNFARFIYLLSDEVVEDPGKNTKTIISQRTIDQLNAYLATNPEPIDFTVPITVFEAIDSPVNRLLGAICFFPADARQCGVAPTEEEIATAESKLTPEGQEKPNLDPNIVYKEDLIRLKALIEDARRTTEDKTALQTENQLLIETQRISRTLASDYYLDSFDAKIIEGDNSEKTLTILSQESEFTIEDIEVVSSNESILSVINVDAETRQIEFSAIGAAGEEATLIINFKTRDDYRWYRKTYRVNILPKEST